MTIIKANITELKENYGQINMQLVTYSSLKDTLRTELDTYFKSNEDVGGKETQQNASKELLDSIDDNYLNIDSLNEDFNAKLEQYKEIEKKYSTKEIEI